MSYQDLLYRVEDGVATITLNRPEQMNTITPNLHREMHAAFDEADVDPLVKVIVLTGSGKAFCAGMSSAPSQEGKIRMDPAGKSHAEYIEMWDRLCTRETVQWEHMWRLGKPIIAAVNGWAMGAGFWYQLAADITIASDKATFGQPEIRHISNSSYLLTALCGWKAANRWGLTGDHFDAQEAYRIGMINEVVPHDSLMEAAYALAKRMALVPAPSLRYNKAIAMMGLQAAGFHAASLLEGALSTLVHSSHNEYRERLLETQRAKGERAYFELRDRPFQPEPMGPKSAKGRASRAAKKNE